MKIYKLPEIVDRIKSWICNDDITRLEISRLDIKQGDVVIIKFPYSTGMKEMDYIYSKLAEFLPSIKVIVFRGDVEICIARDVSPKIE